MGPADPGLKLLEPSAQIIILPFKLFSQVSDTVKKKKKKVLGLIFAGI